MTARALILIGNYVWDQGPYRIKVSLVWKIWIKSNPENKLCLNFECEALSFIDRKLQICNGVAPTYPQMICEAQILQNYPKTWRKSLRSGET